MGTPLNQRQQAVLEWVAAGCKHDDVPVERYGSSAGALAYRGFITIDKQYGQPWHATLTLTGRYWLDHHAYPPAGAVLEPLIPVDAQPQESGASIPDALFINRRRALRADWKADGHAMSYLTANEQWALHAAYHPSNDDMSDAEALAAYHAMEKEHPDRIAAAEAAGARFAAATGQVQDEARHKEQERAAGVIPKRRIAKNRNIQVHGLVRPEIDLEKLARAIINLAMEDPLKLGGKLESPDKSRLAESTVQDTSKRRVKDSSALTAAPSPITRPQAGARTVRLQAKATPSSIQAKVDEAWTCLEAKSWLATVLVARAAMADALADNRITVTTDNLIAGLNQLADQGRLSRRTVDEAAASRAFIVVPTNPPTTQQDVTELLLVVSQIITGLYSGT